MDDLDRSDVGRAEVNSAIRLADRASTEWRFEAVFTDLPTDERRHRRAPT
jgi:hypothetical protein